MATTKKTTAKKTATRAKAAGAKAPQDRLPKAEAQGTPISIRFRDVDLLIDPDDIDDYEAVTLLTRGVPDRFLEAVIHDDEKRAALIESCRSDDGRLRVSAVLAMATELLSAVGAGN